MRFRAVLCECGDAITAYVFYNSKRGWCNKFWANWGNVDNMCFVRCFPSFGQPRFSELFMAGLFEINRPFRHLTAVKMVTSLYRAVCCQKATHRKFTLKKKRAPPPPPARLPSFFPRTRCNTWIYVSGVYDRDENAEIRTLLIKRGKRPINITGTGI